MTTRRSFLSALLSLPVIGRLWPRKAEAPKPYCWIDGEPMITMTVHAYGWIVLTKTTTYVANFMPRFGESYISGGDGVIPRPSGWPPPTSPYLPRV